MTGGREAPRRGQEALPRHLEHQWTTELESLNADMNVQYPTRSPWRCSQAALSAAFREQKQHFPKGSDAVLAAPFHFRHRRRFSSQLTCDP